MQTAPVELHAQLEQVLPPAAEPRVAARAVEQRVGVLPLAKIHVGHLQEGGARAARVAIAGVEGGEDAGHGHEVALEDLAVAVADRVTLLVQPS
ncbi:MAG: hypothetical protein H6732_13255 [Alphaproteobacteria bacterium]|nr:hypothetical protein [Alphaproteobacteria bacterium]